jgi:phosphomannomutase / phosphoglucomutase
MGASRPLTFGRDEMTRASSNKPELVVVVRKPVSGQRMRDMFEAMDSVLGGHPEVGEYNQKI